MTAHEIIKCLRQLGVEDILFQKEKKFGVVCKNAFGIRMKELNELIKRIPKSTDLALELFESEFYEARIICAKIFPPQEVTLKQMERFVKVLDNWEICDTFSMKLFARCPFAEEKINEWSIRSAEFEKRAAFATLAAYCMADKKSDNSFFESFFPLIISAADDERLYVRKAVNWALRGIGKRNKDLNKLAVQVSKELLTREEPSAQWIAKDALKELQNPNVRMSDYPREKYRTQ